MKLIKSFRLKKKNIFMSLLVLTLFIFYFENVCALTEYNAPNETILEGWTSGTGSTHAEINNSVRYPDGDISSFVATPCNQDIVSEFGFETPSTETAMNVTLWVYTGTGGNAQYSFYLMQGVTEICSQIITTNTNTQWFSCTWENPTNDLSILSLQLNDVLRIGGGQPTNANAYIAYLETTLNYPPTVSLITADNHITNQETFEFVFEVEDDHDEIISSCALYGNFSGSWESHGSITNVQNGTTNNISVSSLTQGEYIWNVQCNDSKGASNFANENHTLIVDTTLPFITLINPSSDEIIMGSNEVNFEYEVNDNYNLSRCDLIINDTIIDFHLEPEKNVVLSFTNNLENGYYEWNISCVDEAGNENTSDSRFFTVSVFDPEITNILIENNIILNPGITKKVFCNATIFDENGFENIDTVGAVFFHEENLGEQNNNNYYVNESCALLSSNNKEADYACSFDIWFYAEAGSWTCNVSVINNQGFTNHSYEITNIDTLYALNLSSLSIDYGEVSAGEVSEERELNVFNIGNQPLQVFVRGYGGENSEEGEGLAMVCDDNENISIDNHRYSVFSSEFESKSSLSSIFNYSELTINKQDSDLEQSGSLFWQLFVPPKQVTNCRGTIVVSATG